MMTQQNKLYLIYCLISFLIGMFFFAWHNEILIIKFSSPVNISRDNSAKKSLVDLYFIKDTNGGTWQREQEEMVMQTPNIRSVQTIISHLLNLLLEEKILLKKTNVQSVMIDKSQEAYLSFDRSPFAKQSSTYQKWLMVESILKTLRENGIEVQSVRFLVNNQPLIDNQLDFSKGWPIQGFMQ